MLRIASYNVENLFARPKVFRLSNAGVAEAKLAAYQQVNALFANSPYSAQDKAEIKRLLVELDIYFRNTQGAVRRRDTSSPKWAWLRKNRGSFDRQPEAATKDIEIIAAGRESWIGWVELAKEAVDETSTRMTAKVIAEGVDADVLAVVEAEDRPSLQRFNHELLDARYRHVMLVDGNDERGIDVGIMTKPGFPIGTIRSNVDAEDAAGVVFSRDCPEYQVQGPGGADLFVLVNHFKSQSGGGGDRRQRQAHEVRRIVDGLVADGRHVVVLGDLNEGPKAEGTQAVNLSALFDNNSPLIDVYSLSRLRSRAQAWDVPVMRARQPPGLHPHLHQPPQRVSRRRDLPQRPLGRSKDPPRRLGDLPGDRQRRPASVRSRRRLHRSRRLTRPAAQVGNDA